MDVDCALLLHFVKIMASNSFRNKFPVQALHASSFLEVVIRKDIPSHNCTHVIPKEKADARQSLWRRKCPEEYPA